MSGQHAPLAPSSAPQWGHCSGSVAANLQTPNLESQANREGEATHWVCAQVLDSMRLPGASALLPSDLLGMTAPNGVVIDSKAVEGAQEFINDVLLIAQAHGGLSNLLVEHKVHMPQIHEQNYGTLDCALPLLDKGLIYVWDGKFGHRDNRAFENLQMVDYVAGLLAELKIDGRAEQHITVIMRIVQPFCYNADGPINQWMVKLSDLRGYFNTLRTKAEEAMLAPILTTGKHCRDCGAVGVCSAVRRANYSLIDYVNAPYEMDSMNGTDLAAEYRLVSDGLVAAKARLEALEDDLKHRIEKGATDTGFAVRSTPGRLKWNVPEEVAIAFAGQFSADIGKTVALTPTQATAIVPTAMQGAFKQALSAVASRPAGSLKLVDADSTVAARAFQRKTLC